MSTSTSSGSLGKRAIAFLVLLVAAWILFKVVIGLISFVAVGLVVLLAIAAIIWAIRVL
jgi:hypothetical protein